MELDPTLGEEGLKRWRGLNKVEEGDEERENREDVERMKNQGGRRCGNRI